MYYNKEETACLTGHRPKYLPWGYDEKKLSCLLFKKEVKKIFISEIKFGIKIFLTGMAEGFDIIGAEILIKLRKKYKDIKIIAVRPCETQEVKWTKKQQIRYWKIIKKCNETILLSKQYTDTCMNERNKYMVDNSSVCIACFNGKPSGTGNTIKYAKKNNCKVIVINPNDFDY